MIPHFCDSCEVERNAIKITFHDLEDQFLGEVFLCVRCLKIVKDMGELMDVDLIGFAQLPNKIKMKLRNLE